MATILQLGDIAVDVVLKDIKNVHLGVYPPTGRVRISAPSRMSLDTIRVFAVAKLDWIKAQQKKLREQERETPREYLERESQYVWGKRYLLSVTERGKSGRRGSVVSGSAKDDCVRSDRQVGASARRQREPSLRPADEN